MNVEILGQLNWLAVIVAAVLYFGLGAVWYMPFSPTGRIWMKAIGFTAHPGGQTPSQAIYLFPIVANLLVAIVTAMLARAVGATSIMDGLGLGLVLWLGFGFSYWTLASVFNPHARQPLTLIGISGSYHLVGLLLAGAIVTTWV